MLQEWDFIAANGFPVTQASCGSAFGVMTWPGEITHLTAVRLIRSVLQSISLSYHTPQHHASKSTDAQHISTLNYRVCFEGRSCSVTASVSAAAQMSASNSSRPRRHVVAVIGDNNLEPDTTDPAASGTGDNLHKQQVAEEVSARCESP